MAAAWDDGSLRWGLMPARVSPPPQGGNPCYGAAGGVRLPRVVCPALSCAIAIREAVWAAELVLAN